MTKIIHYCYFFEGVLKSSVIMVENGEMRIMVAGTEYHNFAAEYADSLFRDFDGQALYFFEDLRIDDGLRRVTKLGSK